MCVEILFVHVDCRCIARVGTYTCAAQVYKKQAYSNECPNFKSTHQYLRVGERTCRAHVGYVFHEVEASSDEEDELVHDGVKGKGGKMENGKGKGKEVDGHREGGSGVEGIEAQSDGDLEMDVEGETDYDSDEESSSSSGEEVIDPPGPDDFTIADGHGKMEDEAFKSDSEEDGYKGDTDESFSPQPLRPSAQINRATTPVFNKSTNENVPVSTSTVDENDDDAWINTSSPISSSPMARRSTSPPAFTDSPTKRSVSGELTDAMASLSLTRTPSNSRIPSSTRSSVPRPTTTRSVSRTPSKSSTSTETGGLPYLRRTLGSGIPKNTAIPISGIPRPSASTRSLPSPANDSTSSGREEPMEVARRRLSGGRSLRDLAVGSDCSSGSGNTLATPSTGTTALSPNTTVHLSAIENPSISRRSLAHAIATASANDENTPLGNGLRGLRHVGSLNVADKELPALPKGNLDAGVGVERDLPALPKLDGDFDSVEMEKLRKE